MIWFLLFLSLSILNGFVGSHPDAQWPFLSWFLSGVLFFSAIDELISLLRP